MLGKLDAARQAGRFGEAEIALLKEKLAIVVSAFQSEREKREKELEALGSAARVELSGNPLIAEELANTWMGADWGT